MQFTAEKNIINCSTARCADIGWTIGDSFHFIIKKALFSFAQSPLWPASIAFSIEKQ